MHLTAVNVVYGLFVPGIFTEYGHVRSKYKLQINKIQITKKF